MSVCVGCGLDVNGGSGLLEVQLDPAGGITCSGSGLAVTGASSAAISPDACNGITLHAGKLYAPCDASIVGFHDDSLGGINDAIAGANNNYTYEAADTVTITNNLCRSVKGFVYISCGGLYTDDFAAGFLTIAHLEISINGGGYAPVFPLASRRYSNNGTGVATTDFDNMSTMELITLAPSATITYRARMQVNVQGAAAPAGHIVGVRGFRTRWELVQIGAC